MLELEKCWTELSDFIKNNKEQIKREVKQAFNNDPRVFVDVFNIDPLDVHVKMRSGYNQTIVNIDFVDGVQEGKGKIYSKDSVYRFLTYHGNQYRNSTIAKHLSVFNLRNLIYGFVSTGFEYPSYNGIQMNLAHLNQSLGFSYRSFYNKENISQIEVARKEADYHRYMRKTIAEKLPKKYHIAKLLMLAKRFSLLVYVMKQVLSQSPLGFLNNIPSNQFNIGNAKNFYLGLFLNYFFKFTSSKSYGFSSTNKENRFEIDEECATPVDSNYIRLYLTDPDKRILYCLQLSIPIGEVEQRVFLRSIDILCKDINYD